MFRILKFLILLIVCSVTFADEPLLPDEAFQFTAKFKSTDKLQFSWDIADGYYLYQQKFRFASLTPNVKLEEPVFPEAEIKQDKNFGEVKVYYEHFEIEVPFKLQTPAATPSIEITYQGCASAGVCYLPVKKTVILSQP